MLLRQMEYFCAVVNTGSFTKAAEQYFISQSAISQQIKALESNLGVELLKRSKRSFTLTPAGQHFYKHSQDILAQIENLEFEVEGIANGYAAKVTLGYLSRYEGWEIQAAIAAFVSRHPQIEINSVPGSHDELYRMLLSGDVDLAFNDRRRNLSDDFVNMHLFTGFDYIEVSENARFANTEELKVKDLKGATCILIASPELELVEQTFYRDVMNFDCDFRFVRSREEGRMLVAGNQGFMPIETRHQEDAKGTILQRIPLVDTKGPQLSHEYYAFWPKMRTNPLIEECAEILESVFSS